MIIVVITIVTKVINKNKHIEKNSKKQTSEITVIDSSCAWEISEWQSWIHHGNINKLGFLLCNGELLVIESSGDITYQSSSLEENIRKPYHFPRLIKKKKKKSCCFFSRIHWWLLKSTLFRENTHDWWQNHCFQWKQKLQVYGKTTILHTTTHVNPIPSGNRAMEHHHLSCVNLVNHHLLGGFSPPLLKKYDFVSWNDRSQSMEKTCSKLPSRKYRGFLSHGGWGVPNKKDGVSKGWCIKWYFNGFQFTTIHHSSPLFRYKPWTFQIFQVSQLFRGFPGPENGSFLAKPRSRPYSIRRSEDRPLEIPPKYGWFGMENPRKSHEKNRMI